MIEKTLDRYMFYIACADDGDGVDITSGKPLLTFVEWFERLPNEHAPHTERPTVATHRDILAGLQNIVGDGMPAGICDYQLSFWRMCVLLRLACAKRTLPKRGHPADKLKFDRVVARAEYILKNAN